MKKKVELPIVEPIYSTYQFQGSGAATIYENPSIRNWYLNETINLQCNRVFLSGYTTPDIEIIQSSWFDNPYLERYSCAMQFVREYADSVIREMLDNGYYVYFENIDDYYVKGKSWYQDKHFYHDGLICGYDQEETYCILAYNSNWVYKKFYTTQKSFHEGRRAMLENGVQGNLYAIKPIEEQAAFNPEVILERIKEYLNSSLEIYPKTEEGEVYGIVVHDYIAMYVGKLYDGSIPYERMDRRIFRLIWEHKKVMLERLIKMQKIFNLDSTISTNYKKIVAEADAMRMLYASHHMKRRDSLLPVIQKKLIALKEQELHILNELVEKVGGVMKA